MNFEELKKEILKNNGLTCNKELKNANLTNGFMVSINGYEYTTYDIDKAIKKGIEYQNIIKNKSNYYVGFWVDVKDNNKIYVDISKNIISLRDAEKTAKKNLQKAIYNIKNNKTIYLNYEIKFYSLYKIIRDKITNDIKDYVFIKGYDIIKNIPGNYRTDKDNYIVYQDFININEL